METKTLHRYPKLWLSFARISLARQVEYKINFISDFIIEICWALVSVLTLEIIFLQTSSISGWNKGEVFLIYSIFRITKALKDIIFRKNMDYFSQLVNSGEFDILLSKPINIMFSSLTRIVAFDRTSQFWVGIVMVWYAFSQLHLTLNFSKLTLLITVILLGTFIRIVIGILIHTPVFWLQKLENILRLELTIYAPARFPRSVFPPLLQNLLLTFVPVLLVAAVPAEIFLGKTSLLIFALTTCFAILLGVIAYNFFFFALRHYSSASS